MGSLSNSTIATQVAQLPISPDGARDVVHIGCCLAPRINAVHAVQTNAQITSLLGGAGEVAEAAAFRLASGGVAYVVPVEPTIVGAVGAVTKVGIAAAGTITPTAAPHAAVSMRVMTTGARGTATVSFSVGGGAYGAAVATAATMLVPGTYLTLALQDQTYTAAWVYTISTAGVVTRSGGASDYVTIDSVSPVDRYAVRARITRDGAIGTSRMRISLDGGRTEGREVPTAATYVIPGTGIKLALSGSFGDGDTYSFDSVPPAFGTDELEAGFDAIKASGIAAQLIHVCLFPATAAAAVTLAETASSLADDWRAEGRYVAAVLLDTPLEDDVVNDAGDVAISTETDEDVITAYDAAADSPYSSLFGGAHWIRSRLDTREMVRPTSWLAAWLLASLPAQAAPERKVCVLPVRGLRRDETVTPGLQSAGINVLRTWDARTITFSSTSGSDGTGMRMMTTTGLRELVHRRVAAVIEDALQEKQEDFVRTPPILLGETPPAGLVAGAIAPSSAARYESELRLAVYGRLGLQPSGNAEPGDGGPDVPRAAVQWLRIAVDQTTVYDPALGGDRTIVVNYEALPWLYAGSITGVVSIRL